MQRSRLALEATDAPGQTTEFLTDDPGWMVAPGPTVEFSTMASGWMRASGWMGSARESDWWAARYESRSPRSSQSPSSRVMAPMRWCLASSMKAGITWAMWLAVSSGKNSGFTQ